MNRWERVNAENDNEMTQRLKVYGGWLVLTQVSQDTLMSVDRFGSTYSTEISIAQSFVPDPDHEWKL